MRKLLFTFSFFLLTAGIATGDTWTVDRVHSDVTFQIRHFVSKATGRFADFGGTIVADARKPQASSVEFTIKAASIDTNDPNRDKHLRSGDFFDVEKFPEITFKSRQVKPAGKNKFRVTGDLTMRGVTRRVTLPVTFLGSMKGPRGGEKAGFETALTLNRKDWGINWNKALDQGGYVLSDEVTITINIEADKKKADPPAAIK